VVQAFYLLNVHCSALLYHLPSLTDTPIPLSRVSTLHGYVDCTPVRFHFLYLKRLELRTKRSTWRKHSLKEPCGPSLRFSAMALPSTAAVNRNPTFVEQKDHPDPGGSELRKLLGISLRVPRQGCFAVLKGATQILWNYGRHRTQSTEGKEKVCLSHTTRLLNFLIPGEPLILIMTSNGSTLQWRT
jgi:hypothetical protein